MIQRVFLHPLLTFKRQHLRMHLHMHLRKHLLAWLRQLPAHALDC
jgi:hypothetical protein